MTGSDTPASGKRRQLTVLFSDLNGSTRLSGQLQAEDYAALLEMLHRAFRNIVPRHGGALAQVQGDGMLALFGLDSREDESRRAAEAALEIHDSVRRIRFGPLGNRELTMHSGIHSGLVLVHQGDSETGRYLLAGETPNIAAALSKSAAPDEILVSSVSLGPDRQFFETGAGSQVDVESVAGPLSVCSIRGRAPVNTRFEARRRRGLSPIVGRQPELERLHGIFERCSSQGLQSVTVVGAAGLGKTRLVEEFLDQVKTRDCLVLRGYCEAYLNAEPLQPLLQILRRWIEPDHLLPEVSVGASSVRESNVPADLLAARLSDQMAVFRKLVGPGRNERPPSEASLLQAVTSALEIICATRPVVVFIDDWQWADDAVRRVFRAVTRCTSARAMLLRSSRVPPRREANARASIIELEPLIGAHSDLMIEALLPEPDPFLLGDLRRAAGGNPLFLEELCHSINARRRPLRSNLTLGEGLQQNSSYLKMLIESRVAQLQPEHVNLVRTAAVIGNVVPIWLLAQMTREPVLEAMLPTLSNLDLLFHGTTRGTVRFKHGLTRDVIFESVGLHDRRALHARIARAVEARYPGSERADHLETLAYHYIASEEFEQAAHYAQAAGDKAMAAASLDRARLQYQAALAALDRLEPNDRVYRRWMDTVQSLAMACLWDAERAHCDIYSQAVMRARAKGDYADVTRAEYWLAYIYYALGDGFQAVKHCERARLAAVHIDDVALSNQIMATLGQSRAIACQYSTALPALDAALNSQRPYKHNAGVSLAFAYSLAAKGMVFADRGHFAEAHACFGEAADIVRDSGHEIESSVWSMYAGAQLWQGHWADARICAERALVVANHIGSRYMSAMSVALSGYADYRLGRDGDARQLLRGIGWAAEHEQALWTAMIYGWAAEVMVELGRRDAAYDFAARALQRARDGERLGEITAYCALAELDHDSQPERGTEQYYRSARASAAARDSRREMLLVDLSEAALRLKAGDQAAARRLLAPCDAAFAEMDMAWHRQRAAALFARLSA